MWAQLINSLDFSHILLACHWWGNVLFLLMFYFPKIKTSLKPLKREELSDWRDIFIFNLYYNIFIFIHLYINKVIEKISRFVLDLKSTFKHEENFSSIFLFSVIKNALFI